MIESDAEEIDRLHRNVKSKFGEGARKRRASIMLDYEIEFRT